MWWINSYFLVKFIYLGSTLLKYTHHSQTRTWNWIGKQLISGNSRRNTDWGRLKVYKAAPISRFDFLANLTWLRKIFYLWYNEENFKLKSPFGITLRHKHSCSNHWKSWIVCVCLIVRLEIVSSPWSVDYVRLIVSKRGKLGVNCLS